jgi:hypothetical protein
MKHSRAWWAALAVAVLCAGCEVTVTERTPMGTLQIDVVDESGPVIGTLMDFSGPSRNQFDAATTIHNVPFRTSAVPGSWSVRITPPPTHVVPPSQPNPVSVTVARDETTVIRFNLVRAAPL